MTTTVSSPLTETQHSSPTAPLVAQYGLAPTSTMVERFPVDDRCVVRHRPRGAQRRPGLVDREAVVSGVQDVLLARHAVGPVRQRDDAADGTHRGFALVGRVGSASGAWVSKSTNPWKNDTCI
jgi:hypothetical protein